MLSSLVVGDDEAAANVAMSEDIDVEPDEEYEGSGEQASLLVDGTAEEVEGTLESDLIHIALDGTNAESHRIIPSSGGEIFLDTGGEVSITNIDAGSGDDRVFVESGGAMTITTGDGNDTVDASGMESGVIFSGPGDLIYGSDVDNSTFPTVGVSMNGGTFEGGSASELVQVHGDEPSTMVSGGGGNDILLAFDGDVQLHGGEGDDFLSGRANSAEFDGYTRSADVDSYSNSSEDTLFGGAGNDILELSNGDVAFGGSGADVFEVIHSSENDLGVARVADFSAQEDSLLVEVGGGDPWDYDDSSYDLSNRVEIEETDGNTIILVDGEVVVQILGATGLSVGIPNMATEGRDFDIVCPEHQMGETSDAEALDVIVRVFAVQSS